MQYRVVLARQERVHAEARLRRELLEADAIDLVRDEYLALLLRELIDCLRELFEENAARVLGVRSRVRRRKQVLEEKRLDR